MAWSMLWGASLVTVWSLAHGDHFVIPASPTYWGGLVYLSIFGSVIAFFAYFTLIGRIGAQKTVYIGVITPVPRAAIVRRGAVVCPTHPSSPGKSAAGMVRSVQMIVDALCNF